MFRTIFIVSLSVADIRITYWGYKEREEKNALLIHAENNYQRAFHELSYNMDMLHDNIGTSLAMNSKDRLSPQFVDLWRISSEALANVSQLPLHLLPFHQTEQFLSEMGNFTYKTAVRNLDDDPLTDDEVEMLKQLYGEAEHIKNELRTVQHQQLNDNLRWMDVDLALVSADEEHDNVIIDGFQTVENRMDAFTEEDSLLWSNKDDKTEKYQMVKGKKKSEEDIVTYTKKLFDITEDDERYLNISKSGEGAEIGTYSVSFVDGENLYFDITEKGAHPLSLLIDRDIQEQKLSLHDGMNEAENFLKKFDFETLEVFQSQQFGNVGLYGFVHTQDDVRVYPDTILVKVALDDGEVIGLEANEYVKNHHQRTIPDVELTNDEAREKVNKNVKIEEESLALIVNDLRDEVITYEFVGTLSDETYRIFINAQTGMEEKVEKLTNTELNFDVQM